MEYQAITQDQPKAVGWAKLFTMHQNYKGVVDWHENNVKFRVFQGGGIANYTEKNYYLSNFKGTNTDNSIQFYDLDDRKGSIECRYILNNENIDVYVKGGREGVPVKMQILECPCLGKLTLYQRQGFQQLEQTVIDSMVKADVQSPNYFFEPVTNGSKFYIDTNTPYKPYVEYSVDRFSVTMKAELTVTNTAFTGTQEYVFTISTDYVPLWAIPANSEYVEFTQEYSYKPSGSGTGTVHGNKCRVQIYKNGQVKADGMKAMSSDISKITLYLNLNYKRFK